MIYKPFFNPRYLQSNSWFSDFMKLAWSKTFAQDCRSIRCKTRAAAEYILFLHCSNCKHNQSFYFMKCGIGFSCDMDKSKIFIIPPPFPSSHPHIFHSSLKHMWQLFWFNRQTYICARQNNHLDLQNHRKKPQLLRKFHDFFIIHYHNIGLFEYEVSSKYLYPLQNYYHFSFLWVCLWGKISYLRFEHQ